MGLIGLITRRSRVQIPHPLRDVKRRAHTGPAFPIGRNPFLPIKIGIGKSGEGGL